MKLKAYCIFALITGVTLLPFGAAFGITIVGGLTHERSANPGETYQGAIFVKNKDNEPREVKFYQTDYLFFADGTNVFGEPGKTARSNAKWISFKPKRLVILPKESVPVNYTIQVPKDETLTGTYWSMLMVEEIPKGSSESSQAAEDQMQVGICQVLRYGVQMVSHIGNTGTRKLKFFNTKLLKESGKRILRVDIENTGTRWLRPLLWVELYSEKGGYIGRFEGERLRICPGTSVRHRIDLSKVSEQTYKALVVADAGEDAIFGAKYTLKLEK